MTDVESVPDPLTPGRIVTGVVTGHHPWGIDLQLDAVDACGTVDIRFVSDDPADVSLDRFPPRGARLAARVQGVMPNGQLRLTIRDSDVTASREG